MGKSLENERYRNERLMCYVPAMWAEKVSRAQSDWLHFLPGQGALLVHLSIEIWPP